MNLGGYAWEMVVSRRLTVGPRYGLHPSREVADWAVWGNDVPGIIATAADPVQAVLDAVRELERREAEA